MGEARRFHDESDAVLPNHCNRNCSRNGQKSVISASSLSRSILWIYWTIKSVIPASNYGQTGRYIKCERFLEINNEWGFISTHLQSITFTLTTKGGFRIDACLMALSADRIEIEQIWPIRGRGDSIDLKTHLDIDYWIYYTSDLLHFKSTIAQGELFFIF